MGSDRVQTQPGWELAVAQFYDVKIPRLSTGGEINPVNLSLVY